MAPADRAGPLAVDVDEPDARGLQPAQDLLGLLGGRGGRRPGTRQHGLGAGAQGGDVLAGVRRRAGSRRRRRAGRGVRRGPPSGRRPPCARRRSPGTGSAPRAAGCGPRHAGTRRAGRGGPPASSKRSPSASVAIRPVSASTTSSARRSRVSRSVADHGGVGVALDAAVAGGEAAAHLGQDAGRRGSAGRGSRPLHWRTGNASWRAARHFSAALRDGERAEVVGRVRRRAPAAPGTAAATARRVSLIQCTFSGNRRAAVVARLVLGDQPQLAHLGLERRRALDAGRPCSRAPTISPIRERVSEAVK